MNKVVQRIAASAMALCMVGSMGAMSAFAAGPYADGTYTATATFLHESKNQPSMCNQLLDHDVDIVVSDGMAEMKIYAVNPVPAPAFASQGADGTVKNVVMTLGGVQYPAVSDMETKPLREMDETNPGFGVEAGVAVTTQVLTFTVPADQLDSMATEPAKTDAYVNVAMNTDVIFRIKLENIVKVVPPTEESQKSMQITASVAAPAPRYSVTIPETVAMGTLSADEDNTTPYTVDVAAENLGSGKVVVSAGAAGQLSNGENTLDYANDFGKQETSVTASLRGSFSVSAANVKAAAAGAYTGTADFAIAYYAAE